MIFLYNIFPLYSHFILCCATDPLPPGSLQSESTISEIDLSWLPPLNGNYYGYQILYWTGDELPIEEYRERSVEAPSMTLERLDPDTLYSVEIRAYSGEGDIREYSAPIAVDITTRK